MSPRARHSGQDPVLPVVAEAEVDESAEVDGGDAGGESVLVAFDAAVADAPVAFGDEPGDGPFDHRAKRRVGVVEVVGASEHAAAAKRACLGWTLMTRPALALMHRWQTRQPLQAVPKRAKRGLLIVTVTCSGQVTVIACRSIVKYPPATAAGPL